MRKQKGDNIDPIEFNRTIFEETAVTPQGWRKAAAGGVVAAREKEAGACNRRPRAIATILLIWLTIRRQYA
ncbi:hypothetical protein [Bradyrhizobium sp.]|uniref:hypothetical protein n=1 Tax=Bradyrhizobium sp. TaxID=376 RepID=UPI0027212398|nr:hypothetical protein [Bradyrhizobium sp.]MDO9297337.1 hypothetical protein [Bradyrhizobium sp.]